MKFDILVIGGGLAGTTAALALQKAGKSVAMLFAGLSIHEVDWAEFERLGGTVLIGDVAFCGKIEDGKVSSVTTSKLGTVQADAYVLATGKFFSRGIVATMDSVYEPIFGLDVCYEPDREKWFDPNFDAPQPFLDFGIETEDGHPLKGGKPVQNLWAAGEVLKGVSNVSGQAAQAIIDSATAVANSIIK